jgi:hypothetical protein
MAIMLSGIMLGVIIASVVAPQGLGVGALSQRECGRFKLPRYG